MVEDRSPTNVMKFRGQVQCAIHLNEDTEEGLLKMERRSSNQDVFDGENGSPQVSVIILFTVMINDANSMQQI